MQAHEKLMNARCRLITREPFYGSFAMGLTYQPYDFPNMQEEAKTIAVRMMSTGNIDIVYYPNFIDNLTIEECYGVIMHEIEHVIRLHCLRGSTLHQMQYNIAADMTVNGVKRNPRVGYPTTSLGSGEYGGRTLPHEDKLIWIPLGWPEDASAEEYYKRLTNQAQDCKKHGKNKDQHAKCTCAQGQTLDNHDIWQQSDISEDEARQIIKEMTNQAITRNQGKYPSHLTEAIKELSTPKIRWRELLRRYIGQHLGNKRYTHSRRNRRTDQFGIKGTSHHAAATVNIIIDTSGSINQKDLATFFAEIDTISSKTKTHILQWDMQYQGYSQYRRGDWKKININGRGGTDMAAPYEWLENNNLVADLQILLTDGHTNWAPPKPYPSIVIITTNQKGPTWGHNIHITTN